MTGFDIRRENFVASEPFSLKLAPQFNERWLQGIIESNPAILGLGSLDLVGKQRRLPGGGRLDMILEEPEGPTRYVVELQLGRTDEAHIIRTIEYWDLERRQRPKIDHYAVLVAENLTARFLNVIALFARNIPLIAIQMQALKVGDKFSLAFAKIMDEGGTDAATEEEEDEPSSRQYWEQKASPASLEIVDGLLELARTFDQTLNLRYLRNYVGIERSGDPFNFIAFRPKKRKVNLQLKLPRDSAVDEKIENSGLNALAYNNAFGLYQISLPRADVDAKREPLRELIGMAYAQRVG